MGKTKDTNLKTENFTESSASDTQSLQTGEIGRKKGHQRTSDKPWIKGRRLLRTTRRSGHDISYEPSERSTASHLLTPLGRSTNLDTSTGIINFESELCTKIYRGGSF